MKDYSLYEKVNSILSSKTNKLAENILFGRDGIHINSNNYYQELITSFNMKKESIIPKVNNKIIFYIDNNKEEIWNIIFLGKILQEKAVNFNNEEFNEAVKDVMLLNTPVKPVDDNALEELRKSIRVIQKFKDSTMHNQTNDSYKFIDTDEECKIVINNNGGKFPLEVSIPIRYIEGFNKGTIIPLREDKDIEYKTNDIAYPLLEALDYDPKKLANFFYRVDPEILSLLLDKCDNDVKKLYQLPTVFFSHLRWFKANIKSAIKKYDFEALKNMPYSAGSSRDFWRILDKYGKDILYLPNYFFHRSDTLEKLIDKYGIELVKTLPEDAIYDFDSTVKIIEENKDKTNDFSKIDFIPQSGLLKAKKLNDDLKAIFSEKYKVENEIMTFDECMKFIFRNGDNSIVDDYKSIYRHMDSENRIIEKLFESEYTWYYNINKLLLKYDIKLLSKLPCKYAFDTYEDTCKYLDKYGEEVEYIPKAAFGKYGGFDFFDSIIEKNNLDFKKIKLSDYFDIKERQLYKNVINKKNTEDMLYNFKGKVAYFKKSNFKKLLSRVDNDYSRLNEFPSELFECDTTILDELLKRYESNVMRSIFGINNPKVISLLIYMRSVFDKYDSKELSKDNKFINDLSNVDTKIIKDDNEYKKLINEDIIKYDDKFKHVVNNYYWKDNNEKINYLNRINEYSYINYEDNIKHDLGMKLNNELIRHLRNSVSHFRFKVIDDETIKLYDENENGNVVFDKNYNIYELLNFVHDIEKCLNNDIEEKELIEICSNMGLDKYNKVVICELLHIMSINKELNLNNEKEKSVKM